MRNWPRPGTILGYCTNVHAGATLEQTRSNLDRHALAVKQRISPGEPMGIGLWLSAEAARELVLDEQIEPLHDWLGERGLMVFTLNGFPYHDFHQPVVKHAVYRPDWSTEERQQYTMDLMTILSGLLPEGGEGSISTLPLKWRSAASEDAAVRADVQLQNIAQYARLLEKRDGRFIHVDIEPEPGCAIERSDELAQFFEHNLLFCNFEAVIRRHIRVCHDVCHAAVMFEPQRDALENYRAAGITVGKVQISSAIRADLRNMSETERRDAIAQLGSFAEDRYLHQTTIADGGELTFHEDLPVALEAFRRSDRAGDEWRVHYHVPIYLESFGLLQTTRDEIATCLELLRDEVNHWEIETYAWNVLPEALQVEDVSEGIAREFQWLLDSASEGLGER